MEAHHKGDEIRVENDDETPDYLRGVQGLSVELARLASEADSRRLTKSERDRLRRAILAARHRVAIAREQREGRAITFRRNDSDGKF